MAAPGIAARPLDAEKNKNFKKNKMPGVEGIGSGCLLEGCEAQRRDGWRKRRHSGMRDAAVGCGAAPSPCPIKWPLRIVPSSVRRVLGTCLAPWPTPLQNRGVTDGTTMMSLMA